MPPRRAERANHWSRCDALCYDSDQRTKEPCASAPRRVQQCRVERRGAGMILRVPPLTTRVTCDSDECPQTSHGAAGVASRPVTPDRGNPARHDERLCVSSVPTRGYVPSDFGHPALHDLFQRGHVRGRLEPGQVRDACELAGLPMTAVPALVQALADAGVGLAPAAGAVRAVPARSRIAAAVTARMGRAEARKNEAVEPVAGDSSATEARTTEASTTETGATQASATGAGKADVAKARNDAAVPTARPASGSRSGPAPKPGARSKSAAAGEPQASPAAEQPAKAPAKSRASKAGPPGAA